MAITYQTPVISKIKLPNSSVSLIIKDAEVRTNLDTLLGDHALEALKAAAWMGVDATISSSTANVPTSGAVKTYVEAEISKIPKLDIVVCEADATKIPAGAEYYKKSPETIIIGTMAASADTMYKIYMVLNEREGVAGSYLEWLTVKEGENYKWEKIGNTKVDLSNYVQKTTTIAGVSISDGISDSDLKTALGLKSIAYADKVTATYTPGGSVSTSVTSTVNLLVSTGSYIPEGSISKGTGTANYTPEGSISVGYTPEGTVTGSVNLTTNTATISEVTGASAEAPVFTGTSATLEHTVSGTITASTVVKPAGTISTITLDTISVGSASGWNAGTQASFTRGEFTQGTTPSWTGTVAEETLTFSWDAGTLPTHAADTFTANTLPTLTITDTTVAKNGSYTPTFTGSDLTVTVSTAANGQVVIEDHTYTPAGTNSAPTITLTSSNKTFVTGVSGEVTGLAFAGKAATISTALVGTGAELKFTGTQAEISTSGEYATVTAVTASFTGTQATIESVAGTLETWTPKASY